MSVFIRFPYKCSCLPIAPKLLNSYVPLKTYSSFKKKCVHVWCAKPQSSTHVIEPLAGF